MKRFSHRHGFDPDYSGKPIKHEAPDWLKRAYQGQVLNPLLFIDHDTRQKNADRRSLGIKDLISRLITDTRTETDDLDFDSWSCWEALEARVLGLEWYQFFDFVETVGHQLRDAEAKYDDDFDSDLLEKYRFRAYRQAVNELFSEHRVEWRVNVDGMLEAALPKDLEERVANTEAEVLKDFQPARQHYAKARRYILSPNRDPENSIKESVSAVESICRTIYPRASTLGAALKEMQTDKLISPMLITVFEKFYAYANAAPAVRHGSREPSSVLEIDAELALHISAAFIRAIIAQYERRKSES